VTVNEDEEKEERYANPTLINGHHTKTSVETVNYNGQILKKIRAASSLKQPSETANGPKPRTSVQFSDA